MADPTKPIAGKTTKASSSVLQLIAQAVVDLHIARRNFLIYPATHEQARRSLDRAYGRLSQVLKQQPSVKLIIHKDGLAVGKFVLPAKNSIFKDLASVFKRYQIAILSFKRGLEKDELVRFIQLIVTDRDTIIDRGGIDDTVKHAGLSHIDVQIVDYGLLQVTEESEISRAQTGGEARDSIWQQFVARLTDNTLQGGDRGKNAAHAPFDPGKFAGMLNNQQMDVALAIEQYELAFAALSDASAIHESLSEGLPQFQQMIKELTPKLQSRFLSATFDQCAQSPTLADTARLVDGLGSDLVFRMLEQANAQDKELSPSLMAFVKKMAHLGAPGSGSASTTGIVPGEKGLGSAELNTLLAHEQYDQYVDKGYGELLEKIVSKSQNRNSTDEVKQFQIDIEKSITAANITSHVGRAMMALMNKSHDTEGYRQWARQLAYLLDDLLESHAFQFMNSIIKFVCKEKSCGDAEKAKIAGLVLDRFSDPDFVARAVEIVQAFADQVPSIAMEFLSTLGEPVVVEIFDGLDPNETFCVDDTISTSLLDNLAAFTTREAIERLGDPRPDYVRRMIRIVRRMGDPDRGDQIKALLQHEDVDVRLEALATLLEFKNKWGLIRLRDILGDPLSPEFFKAIALAGRYKVKDASPQLIAYAERTGGDLSRQEAAIRALGNIGDVQAVPVLNKLARRRWSISKKHKHHIKRVVFETLAGYPPGEVKALVHFGLKHKDAVIKSLCEQVLREQLRQ